jgi:alkylation response protein AidB-like acyl-CoA dehydrogenase
MRISLTEEQIFLQKSMKDLFAKECPPELVRKVREDGTDGTAPELWKALTGAGVFGLPFAEDVGGEGGNAFDLGLVYEQAGRFLCPTLVYTSLAFGLAIDRLASAEQAGPLLRRLAAGELTGTVSLGNPGDPRQIDDSVVASRRAGAWVLNGKLAFLQNGDVAQRVLVLARTDRRDGPERLVGFVLSPGGPGWNHRRLRTFGHDVQVHVVLDDVGIDDSDDESMVIGASGPGLPRTDVSAIRNLLTSLQCMEMVGGAAGVLDRTVDYVKVRHQFSRPIASFQAVQHHVADMRMAIDGARLVAYQAIWWTALGHVAEREVAIAKLRCNSAYKRATLTAHQLHGGMGYLRETDLHMWSERAKVTELLDGTDEIQIARIGRALGLAS